MAETLPLKDYRPYRPSNGTEGCLFYDDWCSRCARDKPMSEGKNFDDCGPDEVCQIVADTLAYSIDDPKYPKEWVYGAKGPMCSAFVPVGMLMPERCKHTADMFEEKRNG